MDVEIKRWILEFLLRQPISDLLAKKILANIYVPESHVDRRLKKTLILRSIVSEIGEGSVSETILDSLESLEELDRKEGIKITDSMKAAYRAVAVECAVKYLGGSPQKRRGQGRFFEAVERIWRGRIGRLEKESELVTDDLREIRDEIEAAVWDSNACKRLLERNTRNEALSLVRDYVGEAMAIMGPSFLELVARTERELKEKAEGTANACRKVGFTELAATKEDQLEKVPLKHKKVAYHSRHKGKAKIADFEELDLDTSLNKYDILPSPEVNKVQESLKSSCMDLQAVVKDPLPDALHLAETLTTQISRKILNQENLDYYRKGKDVYAFNTCIASVIFEMARKMFSHEPSLENQNGKELVVFNPAGHEASGPLQTKEDGGGMPSCSNQLNASKPSLMERNSTARTYEVQFEFFHVRWVNFCIVAYDNMQNYFSV
uniref:Uncharacterized protein LOC105629849 n=1 Tax=Rhizophora mucronata TaxID=61149 RepID=A0A2P2IPK3_RHIMU